MKKQIAIAALSFGAIVLGTNKVQAQTTATTTVNIQLADVIAIDATSAANGNTVGFNYATADDYNKDQTVEKPSSLIVTSTKNFNVNVKAGGENFVNGTNKIPVNVMTIKALSAAGTSTVLGTKSDVVLSSTKDQLLVSQAPKGSALTLNLDYFIPKAKSSSADILGQPAGTYTQTVTYTATAL